MATANKRADKQKEKERKEKILLAVLVVLLIIVGAVMLPGMLKKKGNVDQAAAQPAVTTAASTTPGAVATPTGGTPATGASQVSGAVAGASFPSTPTYQPEAGQLSKFGLFVSGDPFGNVPGTGTETSATTSSTATTKTKTKTTTTTAKEAYTAALISVNGAAEVVNLGASFPAASPMFGLNSIAAKSITISVAGGSFSNGRSTVKIQKGHTLVLVNTVDGTRYAIKLITCLKAGEVVTGISTSPGTTSTDTGESSDTGTSSTTASTTTTTASTTTTTASTTTTTTGT